MVKIRMRTIIASLLMYVAINSYGIDSPAADANKDTPLFVDQGTVPPGFENLSKPQRTLVDIYYGNRFLGSQLLTYTPTTVQFSDPEAIVRMVGDINDPALIEQMLTGEISNHSDKACSQQRQSDCGSITPDVAAIIFDERRFRIDVFVNRRFLVTRAADVSKYLSPSDGNYSFVQNLSATLSGTHVNQGDNAADNNDYTFYGTSVLAKRENSLYAGWDYSSSNNFSVASLYGQRDFEGVRYRGGIINSEGFGLSFTSDRTLVGASIGSSTNTRTDTGFSGGMPLEIFLSNRGRVEVRRDNRLIASFFLEAGSQQLNTSSFPSGAYDLEIKILDDQGNAIRTETRFFAKQSNLPAEGEWGYFLESGKVLNRNNNAALPEVTAQFLARSGVGRRLSDTLGATAAVALTKNSRLIEAGLFNLGYRYELSPSLMLADNGAHGAQISGLFHLWAMTVNGYHRQLWSNNYDSSTLSVDDPALLGSGFRQSTVSFATALFNGTASYRFSENYRSTSTAANNASDDDVSRTHTVSYRRSLYRDRTIDIDIDTSYNQSENDKTALLSFTFRLRDNHWAWRATPSAERKWGDSDSRNRERMRVSGAWDDKGIFDSIVRGDFGAEVGTGDERYDGHFHLGNSWGQSDLSLNHVVGSENTTTSYSATITSSFAANEKNIALGGSQRAESALMVSVSGSEGDVFDVLVNGQKRGYAIVGRPSLVPLPPYGQYRVRVVPTASSFYEFDESERSVTLYPGNVVHVEYKAVALQLLFGRLLFNGEALQGARIEGGQYPAVTDDYGLFQFELSADKDTVDVVLKDGRRCQLSVPKQPKKRSVVRMGNIDLSASKCFMETPVLQSVKGQDSVQLTDTGS